MTTDADEIEDRSWCCWGPPMLYQKLDLCPDCAENVLIRMMLDAPMPEGFYR